jgi:hypothetical protein
MHTWHFSLDTSLCYIHIYMYIGLVRGEMEPGPVKSVGPPPHSKCNIYIFNKSDFVLNTVLNR